MSDDEIQIPGPEEERRVLDVYYDAGDGSGIRIVPSDKPLIDRAVELWVASGGTRDTWLTLTATTGAEFQVLASSIRATLDSTRASRRIGILLDRRDQLERKMLRNEAGFVPGEDDDE